MGPDTRLPPPEMLKRKIILKDKVRGPKADGEGIQLTCLLEVK